MPTDTFQLAAQRARQSYSVDDWVNLRPHERTAAIYRELRRIDASHAAGINVRSRRLERVSQSEAARGS